METQDWPRSSRSPLPVSARSAQTLPAWAGPQLLGWMFIFKVKIKLAEEGSAAERVGAKLCGVGLW